MDLESECSALESVEDNEVTTPERLGKVSETKIENNGSCGGEQDYVDDQLSADAKGKDVEVSDPVNSPSLTVKSPGGSVGSSSHGTAKGYGLKKWRRIKREFNKDGSSNVDTSKILKRGSSGSVGISTKSQNLSADMKQKSEGSVSSTNGMVKSPGVAVDGFALHGLNLGSPLVVEPNFAATDSENSEDRSSKSSTAASAPRLRYEIPVVVGYAREKNRVKNPSGKNLGNVVQRQGKGRIETSKKPRGERVKIEKENSHSSMESDSRSSNFVFMQGTNSVTSNGRQSGRSTIYDGENSDEAQGGEQQFSQEIQTGYSKENVGKFEDLLQEDLAADLSWDVKEEKGNSHGTSTDGDPLVESILTLQSAQEALEKELQKLREIGKENVLLFDDSTQDSNLASDFISVDPNILEASTLDQLHSREIRQHSSDFLETQLISLEQNVNLLENKLEEARTKLKAKEAKVIELEATLASNMSLNEEMGTTIDLQQKNQREMEAELEGLFKHKIEAEVEYLAISRTVQNLRAAAVDQIAIFEEQNTLALEQARMLSKLGEAESKAAVLEKQAQKLETKCRDVVETDEVLKLQKRVCRSTSFFFIQLVLLSVVLLFVLQLSPHYAGVVPT